MTPSHWLLMLAVNLAFGLNLVASKFVLSELPPLAFVALRFAVVLVILAPFLRVQRGQMPVLLGVGLLMGTVHFALLIFGLQQAADVSTVAILVQLGVPLSTLMSVLFLGEVIRWRRTLGIAVSFLGVMIIGFDPRVFACCLSSELTQQDNSRFSGSMSLAETRNGPIGQNVSIDFPSSHCLWRD